MKRIIFLFATAMVFAVGNVYGQGNEAINEYALGCNYYYGENGQTRNLAKAFDCFKKAAEMGYVGAFNQVGNMCFIGEGTPKDVGEAVKWFQKAADNGDEYGQYYLAWCYQHGTGVAIDFTQALSWYRKSAANGCVGAYNQLGYMLETGQGEKKPEEAFSWYKKSADAGDPWGQYYLALCYINGTGGTLSDLEAKIWLQKSAAQGNQRAKVRLAEMGSPDFLQKPVVEIIGLPADVMEPLLTLDMGVKARNGRVTKTAVYLNGKKISDSRSFVAVKDDGYDIRRNIELTLHEGLNTVRVEATNRAGTGVREQTVTYTLSRDAIIRTNAEKRLALIIGNSKYIDRDKQLSNPANDATDMAQKLVALGFDTIIVTDANRRIMDERINEFGQRSKNYDVALFYYAGHGIQSKGLNFLIPIDATLHSEGDVQYNCVNAGRVLTKMDESHCRAKIVILDACRNNPFARSWSRGAGGANGLSVIDAPEGTFIAYATNPGNTAADGVEGCRNSPYTEALLKMLDRPNLSLEKFFKMVLREVKQKTNGGQTPWSSSSFDGEFYFNKK